MKEMERILMDLMDDLFPMEYTKERKGKVLRSEIVGCLRLLDRVAKGETPRLRKVDATPKNRRYKRHVGMQVWFRFDSNRPDAWEV